MSSKALGRWAGGRTERGVTVPGRVRAVGWAAALFQCPESCLTSGS
jgi:hypothetical protein